MASRQRMSRMATIKNLYEAATLNRRTQGWRRLSTDSNSENRFAIGPLRDVARDMVRNNAYAARAKSTIAHNVVGAGILWRVNAGTTTRVGSIKSLLKKHFDTTDVDADGRLNLYGLQSLAISTIVEAGEVLIRKRVRRPSDGYALPFQIQILEPDYLDTNVNGEMPNGNTTVQGIEYDLRGKRVAYYLFDQHPGSIFTGAQLLPRGKRVSADFVAHIFRVDRPGQVRGVSWFAPVILRMRDFADYTDAALMRQKIASCFAAFKTTNDDDGIVGGTTAPDVGSPYPVESFEPGMIERLAPGESITFATPPTTSDFGPYASVTLHEVATGLNVPYEDITGDLSNVSFISGRLGRLAFRSSVDDWRWNMLVPQMLDPIAAWTLEAASVVTGSSEPFVLKWTPPPWAMLDPAAEIAASKDAVRNGFSWLSEEQRAKGFDPDDVREGILEDYKWLDKNGVVLDSDARAVSGRGVSQKGDAPKKNAADLAKDGGPDN